MLSKIFVGIASVSALGIPLVAGNSGWGVSSIPQIGKRISQNCPAYQKDQYGRCPFVGSSMFRNRSIGNGSSTGGSGGVK
jgi:hypothetical protein